MKIDSIQDMTEFLDIRLGEDCYIHDYALIGKKEYYLYENKAIDKLKEDLLTIFSELLADKNK